MALPSMQPLIPPPGRASGLPAPRPAANIAQPTSRFGLLQDILDKLNQGQKTDES